jgi:hypothetical protein
MYALKSAEGPDRCAWNVRKLQVQLHDLIACKAPAVGHRGRELQGIAGVD